MEVYMNVEELIGNTPLLKLTHLGVKEGVNLYAKLELYNPAGSVKDRVGQYMIKDAEERVGRPFCRGIGAISNRFIITDLVQETRPMRPASARSIVFFIVSDLLNSGKKTHPWPEPCIKPGEKFAENGKKRYF